MQQGSAPRETGIAHAKAEKALDLDYYHMVQVAEITSTPRPLQGAAIFKRSDPKAFFSNERTFVRWLSTAAFIGSAASGLNAVSVSVHKYNGLTTAAIGTWLVWG